MFFKHDSRGIGQTKRHNLVLKATQWSVKCGLPLISSADADKSRVNKGQGVFVLGYKDVMYYPSSLQKGTPHPQGRT